MYVQGTWLEDRLCDGIFPIVPFWVKDLPSRGREYMFRPLVPASLNDLTRVGLTKALLVRTITGNDCTNLVFFDRGVSQQSNVVVDVEVE